jgi:hypothetical protein
MEKGNQKFIFQLLSFIGMVIFALTGFDGWATVMLLMLLFI